MSILSKCIKLLSLKFFSLFLLSGCLQTTSDLKIESLNKRMLDTQKMVSELKLSNEQIQTQINRINGEIEDMKYFFSRYRDKTKDTLNSKLIQNDEKFSSIEEKNKKQAETIKSLKSELNKQANFISVITNSIKKESNKKNTPLYKTAGKYYSQKKYKKSLELYLIISQSKKTKRWLKELSFLRIGVIYYRLKKYNESIEWLATLINNYPKSKYVPESLYHIGLSFKKLKKDDKAFAVIEEIINKHKKSFRYKSAKKLLKSWKK